MYHKSNKPRAHVSVYKRNTKEMLHDAALMLLGAAAFYVTIWCAFAADLLLVGY